MLTRLRIKNFKCLQDTGDLEIRPLTFLVGPNSSGKSSLLQMLLMLRQTVDSTDINNPLLANNGWIKMGAYPEFIYKHEYKRNLEVNLEFTEYPLRRIGKKGKYGKPKKISLNSAFCYNRKTTQIKLKEREIRLDNSTCERIIRDQNSKKYSVDLSFLEKGKPKKWHRDNVTPIKFYDFSFSLKRGEKLENLQRIIPSLEIFFRLGNIIEKEFRNLIYLGPLREFPKRVYVTSGQTPQDVGIRGERAVDVLWFSHRSSGKKMRNVEEESRNWLRKFGFANDIRLDRLGKENYFRVIIIDPTTGIETNLADIGFGASQTIPIIIESFYASPNSVILIEQPEIHLHPKAQSILGDLFISSTNKAHRTFIVETHSEHILARVRRGIAENKIQKEKVVIYYFKPTPDGTHVFEVTLNKQGQYESFPDGFFEEDITEAFEHLKAIKIPRQR